MRRARGTAGKNELPICNRQVIRPQFRRMAFAAEAESRAESDLDAILTEP